MTSRNKIESGAPWPPAPSDDDAISVRRRSFDDPPAAFAALLEKVRRDVDARLAGYLDARVAETARHGSDVEAMASAVRDLTLRGGKRFRAALVLVGYLSHDDTLPEEAALDAGVAFELLQTYLLVHDDWMDDDEQRRGGPSVPAMLRKYHGSRRLGDAAAVLAGDYAAALSLDVLSRLDTAPDRLVRALGLFAEIEQDVICGQQLDMSGSHVELASLYGLKTGSYTVRGPLIFGALLADAPPRVVTALEDYATPLGIAFQMQDDLLGVFGDPSTTGKPVGEDLRRGKRTAVLAHARRLDGQVRKQVDHVVGNAAATDADVRRLTHLMEEAGVRLAVAQEVQRLVDQAVSEAVDAPLTQCAQAWLIGAASLVASRAR